jgi:hypothetical protein
VLVVSSYPPRSPSSASRFKTRKRRAQQARAVARIARRAAKNVPSRPVSDWRDLESRLLSGAGSKGAKLSPAECRMLSEIMRGLRKRPRGRPRDPVAEVRAKHIAALSILFELDGEPIKVIVEEAAALYGVGRSTVYDARRQWGAQFSGLLTRANCKVRELVFLNIMRNAIDYWLLREFE